MCLEPRRLNDHFPYGRLRILGSSIASIPKSRPESSLQVTMSFCWAKPEEGSQQPANSELPRCKRGQTATQSQFSHCVNFRNESHKALAKSTTCSNWSTQKNNLRQHDDASCSSSKKSCRSKKRHSVKKTESGRSWQARCSDFIINLPVSFSTKIFGPRSNCRVLKNSKCNICDDNSRTKKDQLPMKNIPEPNLWGQTSKKLVQSRVSSLTDHRCHKNVGTENFFHEKANQIDLCCSKISKSVHEVVPCQRSTWKSEKSTTTCKKVTDKCGQSCDNSFPRRKISENYSNDICRRGSKPHEPRLKREAINRTSTSMSERKTPGKCSVRFSNWPTILSEKLFGLRNEKIMRYSVIDNEAKLAKGMNGVTDISEIVSQGGSAFAVKKERLMLKKYTISQTPEAVEETLCFEILPGEQLTAIKTKLQPQASMRMDCDNQKKLATTLERNELLEKCFGACRSRTSKRCIESCGNVSISSSKKMRQLQKKTPIVPIFLSSLIMKVLTKEKDDKNICSENKCHRDTVSGRRRDKKNQHDRKCTLKHRTKTISRKHTATSIHKHRNKLIKRLRYIGNDSRQNKAVSCSLEQNVLLDCCTVDSPKVSAEYETLKAISSDFSSGRKQGSQQGSTRTYHSEDNLDNARDLCKKHTQTMIHGCTDRSRDKSSNVENYQSSERFESSKEKIVMKSGVSQIIDKRCRRESREFCCTVLDRKKPAPKSEIRKKDYKRIISKEKCPCKVKNRNRIKYNDLQSPYDGQYDGEMVSDQKPAVEGKSCTQNHQDITVCKKGFENYDAPEESEVSKLDNGGNNYSSLTRMQEIVRKRCFRKQLPVQAKVCKRLIFKENYISDTAGDKSPQILLEGTRRMFVIAGENIRVKMFDNRETCTDDLPRAAPCQNWKCSEEQTRNQKLVHSQSTLGEKIKNIKHCSRSSLKTEEYRYANLIRNSQSRDTERCYSRSASPKQGPLLNQNDNSSSQKQSENGIRSEVECKKCVRLPCRAANAGWKRSAEISEGEDVLEVEQDAGKVCSSLGQKACGECEFIVCEGKSCLKKASNESQTKESVKIFNEDQFCQSENMDMHSALKINDCLPSVATSNICSTGKEGDFTNESSLNTAGTSSNQPLVNITSKEREKLGRVHLNIHSSEKRGSWITSPRKNSEVTKPESRNIIKSCYSQRKSMVVSRRGAHSDEYTKAKKGKVQREECASEKGTITKTRKPFQQIENAGQVGCTENVVINSDKGKKEGTVEKAKGNAKKKAQHSEDASVFDNNTKNSLTQNIIIDSSSLPYSYMTIRAAHAPSVQKLTEAECLNAETHTQGSKIPKKSRPSTENKIFTRVPGSTTNHSVSASRELKENLCKSLPKKEGNGTAGSTTADAKRTAKKIGKIAENVESESSGGLRRSIDTCDTRDRKRHKELKTPTYVSDKENVEVQDLQIEMSSIGEQVIPNGAMVATNWIAKGSKSSKSSKSLSFQRNEEQREGGENRNSAAAKETEENKQTKRNQSKLKTVSKKNEKDKKSTPLKLLSQIDSKIDASDSTQKSVTMNANLFPSALMDGKNNIKSYRDLQSVSQENSNSNRISASRDEGLRKSGTEATQSKSKVFNSPANGKTSAKKTPEKSKNDQKLKNFQEGVNIAAKDRTHKMSRTFPDTNNVGISGKGLGANSGLEQADLTEHSLSVELNKTGSSRSTTCKKNSNRERNFESPSTARSSKQVQPLEAHSSLVNKSDLQKNPIVPTDCKFEESCISRTLENAALPKDSSKEKSSVCVSREEPNNERLSSKSRVSPCHRKNGTRLVSSRTNLNLDGKTKQGAHADTSRLGSPQNKSREKKSVSKSHYAGDRMTSLKENEKQGKYCGTNRDNTGNASQNGITKDEPEARCEKSIGSACNGRELKQLSKSFQESSNAEQKQIMQHNNDPHKTTSSTSQRRSVTKNFCFTDELKRFLDQGQEFFTSKKKKNSNQSTLYSDGIQEPSPCGSCKSNDSEAWCETTEFCKSVDYEMLENSSKICDEDPTSNNSISSLQRAYSTLKTILSRTKNVKKGFINVKQTKETQTYTPILDKYSTPMGESIKPFINANSPELEMSKMIA